MDSALFGVYKKNGNYLILVNFSNDTMKLIIDKRLETK